MSEGLQKAIELYMAGNRADARELPLQIVSHEPNNERACGRLSNGARTDDERAHCRRETASTNPYNDKAAELLNPDFAGNLCRGLHPLNQRIGE